MKDQQYIDQLKDIRTIMDRSSRFISLSGLSGVLAGIYAILGAFLAHYIIHYRNHPYITPESAEFKQLIAIAAAVMVLSISTAAILSARKAKKSGEKAWNKSSRRLLINLFIPLTTGGIFGILLMREELYGLIAPVTLIFYGLSLVNASRYTLETLRSLGILFIILGLINTAFPAYSLFFWTLGFGLLHILYGTIMYLKFDRKQTD